ncbi:SAV_915 family protein [Streptomyces sp. NPDC018000]|uniref:SAV_915 family protein n=1 Tax=Streptomyces sp. NPDC018000 TaxID=3365028 RepID=UPI0037A04258
MNAHRCGQETAADTAADPGDRTGPPPGPSGLVFVAVRRFSPHGYSIRLFRAPDGARIAVAFTTPTALDAELGPDHAMVRIALPALRILLEPLGISSLAIDPVLASAGPVAVPPLDASHAA